MIRMRLIVFIAKIMGLNVRTSKRDDMDTIIKLNKLQKNLLENAKEIAGIREVLMEELNDNNK